MQYVTPWCHTSCIRVTTFYHPLKIVQILSLSRIWWKISHVKIRNVWYVERSHITCNDVTCNIYLILTSRKHLDILSYNLHYSKNIFIVALKERHWVVTYLPNVLKCLFLSLSFLSLWKKDIEYWNQYKN